jgi:hypothetical protein
MIAGMVDFAAAWAPGTTVEAVLRHQPKALKRELRPFAKVEEALRSWL